MAKSLSDVQLDVFSCSHALQCAATELAQHTGVGEEHQSMQAAHSVVVEVQRRLQQMAQDLDEASLTLEPSRQSKRKWARAEFFRHIQSKGPAPVDGAT
jgi:hypothetical protein